jgi:hypothetical protein
VSQVAAEDAVADEAGELQGPAHLLVVDGPSTCRGVGVVVVLIERGCA